MVKSIKTVLSLAALYGAVAFALAAKLEPKADTDLGPTDFVCPEGFDAYPHETQCELYYLCGAGDTPTHLYHCYSDYLFDLAYYGCNFKELVDCGNRTSSFNCPSPNGKFPISPNACDPRYYVCVNNSPTLEVCPNGEIFDASTQTCAAPGTIACSTTTTSTTRGTPGPFVCPAPNGNFPSPYTCTQFYTCIENVPILNDCPSGLYYNPSIDQCDWPNNVPECTGRKHIKN